MEFNTLLFYISGCIMKQALFLFTFLLLGKQVDDTWTKAGVNY